MCVVLSRYQTNAEKKSDRSDTSARCKTVQNKLRTIHSSTLLNLGNDADLNVIKSR
eukprot:m.372929 g.372929  ORF g.372929 m.372929 type:complete len:56 (+) comp65037_c0_seq1:3-170(+)